jgi:mono/diheme cytochrome c family protein
MHPVLLLARLLTLSATVPAQPSTPPSGKDAVGAAVGAALYRTFCASCHGVGGKGDGPMAAELQVAPPDLTTLKKRNQDRFPFDRVVQTIDGRLTLKGHGTGMPVWGDTFKKVGKDYDDRRVRERITQLVRYIETIQS